MCPSPQIRRHSLEVPSRLKKKKKCFIYWEHLHPAPTIDVFLKPPNSPVQSQMYCFSPKLCLLWVFCFCPMCSEYCPLPSHPSPTQLMRGLKCCMKPHTSPTCWTCPAGSESGPGCAWRQNHSAIFPPPCCLQASFQLLFLLQDPCSCWIYRELRQPSLSPHLLLQAPQPSTCWTSPGWCDWLLTEFLFCFWRSKSYSDGKLPEGWKYTSSSSFSLSF